tara:strand:- start:451 stop:642 length:192 start_codon:yes stop_codon:yes gene_type:complete
LKIGTFARFFPTKHSNYSHGRKAFAGDLTDFMKLLSKTEQTTLKIIKKAPFSGALILMFTCGF